MGLRSPAGIMPRMASVAEAASVRSLKTRAWWQSTVWMVIAAIVLRLVVMGFLYGGDRALLLQQRIFNDESYRVSLSLAAGEGFSSPFEAHTGPTAMYPPVYPLLVAGVFKFFGGYSTQSAVAVLVLNSVLAALLCPLLVLLGRRLFGETTATVAGWAWVLFPPAVYVPVTQVWDSNLAPLLLMGVVLVVLRLQREPRTVGWLQLGGLGGLVGLTTPAILPALPAAGGWLALGLARRRQAWFRGALAATLIFLFVGAPWFVRNHLVFDRFIPFRSGFYLTFLVGNPLEMDRQRRAEVHPNENPVELQLYSRLHESSYLQLKQQQAMDLLREHPGAIALLTLRRVVYAWTGIWNLAPEFLRTHPLEALLIPFATLLTVFALRGLRVLFGRDHSSAWLIGLVLLFTPMTYYLSAVKLRYLYAVAPLMVILAVAGALAQKGQSTSGQKLQPDAARPV